MAVKTNFKIQKRKSAKKSSSKKSNNVSSKKKNLNENEDDEILDDGLINKPIKLFDDDFNDTDELDDLLSEYGY